jgi:hypothetical protein
LDIRYIRASVESFHRTKHRGIPVTTVARTLFDLGAVDARRVPKALEQADVLQLLDVRELQHLVDSHPRRPGTSAIRAALAALTGWRGITRSELEDRFRTLIERAKLPLPEMNLPIELGSTLIEADAVWPDARLIVELDGYAFHGTATAVAAGWRVIRITWQQLANDPAGVIRDLRRALSPPRPE